MLTLNGPEPSPRPLAQFSERMLMVARMGMSMRGGKIA